MEIKRLFNLEKRFLSIAMLIIILIVTSLVFLFSAFMEKDKFNELILNCDYEEIYSYIEEPDFSKDVFREYFYSNFGQSPNILERKGSKNKIEYKLSTPFGEKLIALNKIKGKKKWNFTDYTYGWAIKLPKNAKIFIEDMELTNNEGQVVISKIPHGVYNVYAYIDNYADVKQKIMAGQGTQLKLNLNPESLNKTKEIIQEFLIFKENFLRTGETIWVSCLDNNSGIYQEVIDEWNWLKSLDYKMNKKLESHEINDAYINFDGNIIVDVSEIYEITITNDSMTNTKIDIINNIYTIEPSNSYKIGQIITK